MHSCTHTHTHTHALFFQSSSQWAHTHTGREHSAAVFKCIQYQYILSRGVLASPVKQDNMSVHRNPYAAFGTRLYTLHTGVLIPSLTQVYTCCTQGLLHLKCKSTHTCGFLYPLGYKPMHTTCSSSFTLFEPKAWSVTSSDSWLHSCILCPLKIVCFSQSPFSQFSLVLFKMPFVYSGKHICSIPSLNNFPSVAFETVPVLVPLTMALSCPLQEDHLCHNPQVTNGVIFLALGTQAVSPAPQHFPFSESFDSGLSVTLCCCFPNINFEYFTAPFGISPWKLQGCRVAWGVGGPMCLLYWHIPENKLLFCLWSFETVALVEMSVPCT